MPAAQTPPQTILCLDIGSGTQDALLYQQGRALENCAKFVLPTPAVLISRRIAELSAAGRGIYLHGENMGGGFWRVLKPHLQSGAGTAAHPEAALALGDDLERLRGMGLEICETAPPDFVPVHLSDFVPQFWQTLLGHTGLPSPDLVLAAAQDHGFHPGGSNRIGRFQLWRDFLLEHGGRPEALLFRTPPPALTRLRTLQRAAGQALVADTGAAAVLGALCDPAVHRAAHGGGACVVNLGNSHIVAFLLHEGRIKGVYEHHTGQRTAEELLEDLTRFRCGSLPNQEVLDSWGHGCITLDLPEERDFCSPLFVTGPQRALLKDSIAEFPAPGGDMMLMGCFGLLKGLGLQRPELGLPFSA